MSFIPDSVFYALKSIAEKYSPSDEQDEEECMSERGEKRKIEFIESYWTGGEYGSDYKWSDNHGELVRCRDCEYGEPCNEGDVYCTKDIGTFELPVHKPDWYCADGERRDKDA